jgi:VWFA-related protein
MNLRRMFISGLAVLAAFGGFGAVMAYTQETQGPITPKPGMAIQKAPESSIRVRVQSVNTPVTVRDGKNELVLDLRKENFHVTDNGVNQTIESFDMGGDPLSVILLLESSSRIAPLLPAVRKSAIVFSQTVVGTSGIAAVMGYDNGVQRLQPFTTNHDWIEKAITTLKTGNSGAKLYNAMSTAVGLLRAQPAQRRRVLIVVGEAQDTGSEQRLGEVLRQAQQANIVIYSVGLSTTAAAMRSGQQPSEPRPATPDGTFGAPPAPGTAQTPTSEAQKAGNIDLTALAEWAVRNAKEVVKERPLEVATVATGGMYQSILRDSAIETAIDSIGGELSAQYTLSYQPTQSGDPGYHRINVTVDRAGVKVRTRPGYFLEGN